MRFILFTLLLAVCASAHAATLSLEEIVGLRQVNEFTISPKGRFVAYVRHQPRDPLKDEDGPAWTELHLVDMMGHSRPFVTGQVKLAKLRWSGDGQRLFFIAKRGNDKLNSLYAIPVDGGEAQRVLTAPQDVEDYALLADGSAVLVIAKDKGPENKEKLAKRGFNAKVFEEDPEFSRLWRYNLGDDGLVSGEPEQLPVAGHVMAVQVNRFGDRLALTVSPTPAIDDELMAASLTIADSGGRLLTNLAHRGKLGAGKFSPDGSQLLFIGSADINDPAEGRLYLADVASGKVTDLLPDFEGHVSAIDWLSDRQALYIGDIGTGSRLGLVNLDTGVKNSLIDESASEVLRGLDVSDKGQIALVADSWQHPPEVFALPSPGQPLKRLTISNPLLETRELASQEVLSYKARDGLELQGVLVKPLRYTPGKRYPLIMFVHGGPEAHVANGWVSRYANPAQLAAADGFVSFFPNYRGSTGRGVAFSKLGQGDYAGAEFNDLVDAKQHLVSIGLVDEKKVGITGGSYGGYATAWGATALSEHFAAGVMFVGISDLISKFGTTDIPNEMYLVHARAWPWDHWHELLERSPVYHAQKHRTPLLIMHGENDTRVHPSQSLELFRYLKTLNQAPVRLVLQPGEGHGYRKAASQLDYGQRLMDWMRHYLIAGNSGLPANPDHSAALSAE
ncbi:MAG: S9 family peptidase [Gammaproteobacteria bacterium]|nr:S9 family peptidase [Gammaproteobacteria bacterium]